MRVFAIGRALRHRNFRLFITGQAVSLIGTWMQQVAITWLVYRLTHSELLLGLVAFSSQIPSFLLAPIAGVLSDHWNRQRVLIATQCLSLLQASLLVALTATGYVAVWHLVVLGIFIGLINAFDMPTRQSFFVELLADRSDLPNAIALNSSVVNLARMVGPSIAGLIIAARGETACFLLNAISYVPVIIALARIRPKNARRHANPTSLVRGLSEGIQYVVGFRPILALLMLTAWVSLLAVPLMVLMPIFASEVLGGGPATLGFLMASSGLGALSSALYLASRRTVLGLGRLVVIATAGLGLAMIGFAFSTELWLSAPLVLVTGGCMMLQLAGSNTLLQTIVEEHMRGRVMSFYTMSFLGVAPLGSLAAGTIASLVGAPRTVLLSGVLCMVGATVFGWALPALRELVRPLYERAGILPPVAAALQTSADLETPPE